MRFCMRAMAASKARWASPPSPWVVSCRPAARVTAQSTLKAWPSRLTTTSAPPPSRSKYLPMLEEISAETRERRASPTSTCLPVTWTCMGRSTRPGGEGVNQTGGDFRLSRERRNRGVRSGRFLEPAAALHRGGNAHGLAVFGDRATGDVDAGFLEDIDDRVVGMDVALAGLGVDQLLDLVAHAFGRVGLAALGG